MKLISSFFIALSIILTCAVLLRSNLQQFVIDCWLQGKRRMHHQQKESYRLQGMSFAQMFAGRHVQVGFALRAPIQLVQDSLSAAGAATTTPTSASTAPTTAPTTTEQVYVIVNEHNKHNNNDDNVNDNHNGRFDVRRIGGVFECR